MVAKATELRLGTRLGSLVFAASYACSAGQPPAPLHAILAAPPSASAASREPRCVPPRPVRSTARLVQESQPGKISDPPLLEAAMEGKVAWSSRGNVLAVEGMLIQFWDARRWELVGEALGASPQPIDGTDRFVVREAAGLAVWDGSTGRRLFELEDGKAAGELRFTHSGSYAHDGAIIWDLSSGRSVMRGVEGDDLQTFALREDGRQLVRVAPRSTHRAGGGGSEGGRLILMAVPSGKILREVPIPQTESVFWPRLDTIVLSSNEGLFLGSPNGGFKRMARGAGTLQFSADFQKLAFLPFEAPGMKIIGLAGRNVIAERRNGFAHLLSPTLEHWLRKSDPQAVDETHLVLEPVGGGRSLPLSDVYGWSGDGKTLLIRSGGSVRALDVGDALRAATLLPAPADGREPKLDWQPRPGGQDGVFGSDAGHSAGPVLRWSPAGLASLAHAERLSIGAARFLTHTPGWVLGSCWTDRSQFDGRSPFTCRSSFLGWFDDQAGVPLYTSTTQQPSLLWPDHDSVLSVGHGDPTWGCLVGRRAPPSQSPGVPPARDCPVEEWSLDGRSAKVVPSSAACGLIAPDDSLEAVYEAGERTEVPCPLRKSTIQTSTTRLVFARHLGALPQSKTTLPTAWLSAAGSLGSGAWFACGAPLPAECDHTGQSDCWVWTVPSRVPEHGFRPEGPVRRVGSGGELAYPVKHRLQVLDALRGEASAAWPQQRDPDAPQGANFLPSPRGGFIAVEAGVVHLWQRCGGVRTVDPSLRRPSHALRDWAFSEDDSLLAWIDDAGLTVVSTESLRPVRRVSGLVCGEWLSGGTPRRLSFRKDGRVILVACEHSATLVRVDRPQTLELQAVRLGDSVGWLAVAPDGAVEGTGGVLALVKRRLNGATVPLASAGRSLVARILQ